LNSVFGAARSGRAMAREQRNVMNDLRVIDFIYS